MNTPPENNSAGNHSTNHAAMQSSGIGALLRTARERAGLSVNDVASHLKFAPRQIEALEADDFVHLPETPFLRGFVRNYAKLVQIDAAPLLAALPDAPSRTTDGLPVSMSKEVPFPSVYANRKYNIAWLAGGLVVALVLGIFVWFSSGVHEAPQTKIVDIALPAAVTISASAVVATPGVTAIDTAQGVTPVSPPIVETSALSVATAANVSGFTLPGVTRAGGTAASVVAELAPPSTVIIRMVFEEDAWVEITDKDGTALMGQLNLAGSERRVKSNNPPLSVKIGNADKVKLTYNGKPIDLTPHNRAGVAHLMLE